MPTVEEAQGGVRRTKARSAANQCLPCEGAMPRSLRIETPKHRADKGVCEIRETTMAASRRCSALYGTMRACLIRRDLQPPSIAKRGSSDDKVSIPIELV